MTVEASVLAWKVQVVFVRDSPVDFDRLAVALTVAIIMTSTASQPSFSLPRWAIVVMVTKTVSLRILRPKETLSIGAVSETHLQRRQSHNV